MFIIGHLRGSGGRTVFPVGGAYESIDIEYVGNTHPGGRGISGEVYGLNGVSPTLTAGDYKGPKMFLMGEIKQIGNIDQHKRERENPNSGRVYDPSGISPTLSTMQGGGQEPKIIQPVLTPDRIEKRQNGRRLKEDGEPMFTLTAQDRHGLALGGIYTNDSKEFHRGPLKGLSRTLKSNNHDAGVVLGVGHHPFSKKREFNGYGDLSPTLIATDYKAPKTALMSDFRIRKLTPLECFRLQGFTDEQFYKAKNDGVSNSQLYKQAGNSVTVNVIDAIARKLI